MQCRKCKYPLWNLRYPACPECGTPFDIRKFSFEPGTVAFACPYCGHLHAGKGPRYLPTDRGDSDEAVCSKCGREMMVASMPVIPLTARQSAKNPPRRRWWRLSWWRWRRAKRRGTM